MLAIKLRRLNQANETRRELAARYRAGLDRSVRPLAERAGSSCVYHLFPVRVPERDAVATALRRSGIEVGVHYSPALHGHPALRRVAQTPTELPRAEAWAAEELSLPMSPYLRVAEVDRVAEACGMAVKRAVGA
jgi:dTDP-4-amino-4,6-dideoxygalactose transaminase